MHFCTEKKIMRTVVGKKKYKDTEPAMTCKKENERYINFKKGLYDIW